MVADTAQRIVYTGEPIELLSGRVVSVKYGMRSLMELERRFGGLGKVQSSISTDGSGASIEPTLQLVSAGLLHEHGENGAPLTVEQLADELDPAKLQEYVAAAGRALTRAFPQQPVVADAADVPQQAASTGSPSTPGTTSAP